MLLAAAATGVPEYGYIFRENARDVLNKQNPGDTKKTLAYLAKLLQGAVARNASPYAS